MREENLELHSKMEIASEEIESLQKIYEQTQIGLENKEDEIQNLRKNLEFFAKENNSRSASVQNVKLRIRSL